MPINRSNPSNRPQRNRAGRTTAVAGAMFEPLEDRRLMSTTTGALTPFVTKTSFPASVVTGAGTHGSATVSLSNVASDTVQEVVTTDVYASLNSVIDDNSVLIGTLTKTVTVKAAGNHGGERAGQTAAGQPERQLHAAGKNPPTLRGPLPRPPGRR